MAKEVREEAASKLETADDEHIEFEAISVVINRVLHCVVEAVVADLREAEDNQRD